MNPYCEALGIPVPRLEDAARSVDASPYALLIATLLEKGEPITLEEAARRFDEAGVAPAEHALASLKRCGPARPSVYRDGEGYALDPHHHEAELWAFRLGLMPSKGPPLRSMAARRSQRMVRSASRDLRPGRAWKGDAPGGRGDVRPGAEPMEPAVGRFGEALVPSQERDSRSGG